MSVNIWTRIIGKFKHEYLRYCVKKASYCSGISDTPRKEKIIVSLTSYPARFSQLELCFKSIFLQSMKANRIILWLGNDSIGADLSNLEKLKKYGLEIRIDKNRNLKSHKKYIYALNEFENDLVITVDDDLIYPPDMIESLHKYHVQFPSCIVTRRVHRILWESEFKPKKYSDWEEECSSIDFPSFELLPTTGAGTLYPPNSLYKDFDNVDILMNTSFLADDIWMKFMSVLNGTKIVWAKNDMQMPTTIDLSQDDNLSIINCGEGNNDSCFNELLKYYRLSRKSFID
ncbi:MAG: hypothetical protein PWP62_2288 [Eubacteriaceae bacterium]|nr:hypothetical protein [Eubacteriaceae bacterium]